MQFRFNYFVELCKNMVLILSLLSPKFSWQNAPIKLFIHLIHSLKFNHTSIAMFLFIQLTGHLKTSMNETYVI